MANVQNDAPYSQPLTKGEKRRKKLDQDFRNLCENVYFEPDLNSKMHYPCIMYERNGGESTFSNNKPYSFDYSYKVTVISKDPDERIVEKLASTQEYCTLSRPYKADGLYHNVFTVY